MNWINESIMYNIYPLGFAGAPRENDFKLEYRLDKIYDWIDNFKKLGVNTLVFNPVFESTRHGYDTIDYYKIDSRLGDNNSFKEICKTLHENGIRIILDGVFNHVGRDFFAFKDVQQNREGSQYCSWFMNLNFYGNNHYNDGFCYEGWAGHIDLVKLNLDNTQVVDHLIGAVKFWIEEFGIDGLRLDAADCINIEFFKKLRNTCLSLKPDFWLYGEITSGDYNRWANNDALHSVTNYECYKGIYSSHNDHNYFEIAHSLNRQFGDGGIYGNIYTFNFVDNHDVNRVASMLRNKNHLNNVYTILYTMPGVPCIYYGSEWAVEGKRTQYSDYELRPCLDIDSIPNPNYELYNHICKLGAVRKALPALKYGNFRNVNIKNEQLVYMREYDGQTVYVALNLSDNDFNIDINSAGGVLTDVLTGDKFNTNGYTQIPLKPCSSRILVLNDGSFELNIDENIIPIENNVNEVSDEDILEPIPVKLGKYRHFKGNEYEVIAIAKDSETLEELVVYRALYGEGEVWVRNKANFEEIVERDGKRMRRFTKIEN
jgi:glycosidase